jgi:hypothetical protein
VKWSNSNLHFANPSATSQPGRIRQINTIVPNFSNFHGDQLNFFCVLNSSGWMKGSFTVDSSTLELFLPLSGLGAHFTL